MEIVATSQAIFIRVRFFDLRLFPEAWAVSTTLSLFAFSSLARLEALLSRFVGDQISLASLVRFGPLNLSKTWFCLLLLLVASFLPNSDTAFWLLYDFHLVLGVQIYAFFICILSVWYYIYIFLVNIVTMIIVVKWKFISLCGCFSCFGCVILKTNIANMVGFISLRWRCFWFRLFCQNG